MRSIRTRASIGVIAVLAAAGLSGCGGTYAWTSQQGETISPAGAAYTYRVPDGFFIEDGPPKSTIGRLHVSGLVPSTGGAFIRVSDQSLVGMSADTPDHAAKVEQAFVAQASHWEHPATAWRHDMVANAPTLRYHLAEESSDGDRQEAEEVAVFSGTHLIYVSCNWLSATGRDMVMRACRQVLASLQIVDVRPSGAEGA